MRRSTSLLIMGAALTILAAQGPVALADNSQQSKMTTCNATASSKNLTGDDRKAYMKTCLSAAPPAKTNSQQEKMKSCNATASSKNLTGDDRKAYMKTCLSGTTTH